MTLRHYIIFYEISIQNIIYSWPCTLSGLFADSFLVESSLFGEKWCAVCRLFFSDVGKSKSTLFWNPVSTVVADTGLLEARASLRKSVESISVVSGRSLGLWDNILNTNSYSLERIKCEGNFSFLNADKIWTRSICVVNGTSSSNNISPNEYISTLWSYDLLWSCSGLMYSCVPTSSVCWLPIKNLNTHSQKFRTKILISRKSTFVPK